MKNYVMILTLCVSSAVWAADKDQTLTFSEVASGDGYCITAINPPPDDNCKTDDGKRGACDGVLNCICSKADKHIEWQSSNISNFTVYFYQDVMPFKEGCNLDANGSGKVKCRVKGDASGNYEYGIKVDGCADFDPRIIIKQN